MFGIYVWKENDDGRTETKYKATTEHKALVETMQKQSEYFKKNGLHMNIIENGKSIFKC